MTINADRAASSSDRRRRRMAADDIPCRADLLAEFGIVTDNAASVSVPVSEAGDMLVKRVISRRIWKHVTVLVASTMVVAWMILAGDAALPAQLPSSAETARDVARAVTGVELLVAGQLALVIGWLRSRSQLDYRGRYRAWKWFAVVLLAAGFVTLSALQHVIPDLLAAMLQPLLGTISAARPVLGFLPVVAAGSLVVIRVLPDTSRNRISQLMLGTAVVIAMIRLTPGEFLLSRSARNLFALPAALLESHLIFCGVLLHARFVAWVCNDPPVRANSARRAQQAVSEAESKTGQGSQPEGTSRSPVPAAADTTAPVVAAILPSVKTASQPEVSLKRDAETPAGAERESGAGMLPGGSGRSKGKRRHRKAG